MNPTRSSILAAMSLAAMNSVTLPPPPVKTALCPKCDGFARQRELALRSPPPKLRLTKEVKDG